MGIRRAVSAFQLHFHFFQVDEDEDMGEGRRSGPFTFHMEVHSCTQTQDRLLLSSIVIFFFTNNVQAMSSPAMCAPTRRVGRLELVSSNHLIILRNSTIIVVTSYVCTHKKGGQAGIVTERTIFSCCPGHRYCLLSKHCKRRNRRTQAVASLSNDFFSERVKKLANHHSIVGRW